MFAQGVWQQKVLHTYIWSHHNHTVCLEWHEETEHIETDYIQKKCFNKPTY